MRIALVDDDPLSLDRLFTCIVKELGTSHEVSRFSSGEALLKAWSPGAFDLVILDIFMDSVTGLEAARRIRAADGDVRLVFCTSSNEFASESYEVNASYYLCKPFSAEQIHAMTERLRLRELELSRTVRLPDGQQLVLRNIVYVDMIARHVVFHNKKGGDAASKLPFTAVEPLLCAYPYFFSPSKGIIVNFYEVAARRDDVFELTGGVIVPISRRRAREVAEAYASFRFDRLREGGEA